MYPVGTGMQIIKDALLFFYFVSVFFSFLMKILQFNVQNKLFFSSSCFITFNLFIPVRSKKWKWKQFQYNYDSSNFSYVLKKHSTVQQNMKLESSASLRLQF